MMFLFIHFQLCYCFIHSQKYLFTFIHPPKILFSQSQMVSACFLPSVPSKDHFHNTSSSLVSKYVDPIFYNMDIICLLLYLQFDDCYITRNHIHADCKKLHLHLFLLDYESNIERTHQNTPQQGGALYPACGPRGLAAKLRLFNIFALL